MAFSAPSSNTESVKVADLNGHLLILEAIEYKTGIPTVHGDADAIEVRHVLFVLIWLRYGLRLRL